MSQSADETGPVLDAEGLALRLAAVRERSEELRRRL